MESGEVPKEVSSTDILLCSEGCPLSCYCNVSSERVFDVGNEMAAG